ncbi:hypothetical protein LTR97_010224 [Elasticomyces elasticus]|uniref:Glutathione S-transferase kappa n=1 Tax=Elasticomyces elasticus TaxID=574655 RepID=A0AAN7VMN8_9PEZI|nr:hypothetical protein LTR97_010224 [Elasticomyces elasticus]
MATKKIECFIDCVSPYSYYAFVFLKKNRDLLEKHGVEVEFVPVFLGGINVGSGNKPPGELPAKAKYSKFDSKRAQKYFGLSFETPSFFPILSLRPQRSLIYTKANYPRDVYETLWLECFRAMWEQHLDLSIPANMLTAIERSFPDLKDVEPVMKSSDIPEIKKQLTANTEHAFKDCGAFGAPWYWVSDGKGRAEPFFGSDRFNFMWEFLGVPCCGHEVLEPGVESHERARARL